MTDRPRLAAVSVDLDEVGLYHRIHGLAQPVGRAARAVYERALPRYLDLLAEHGVPATLFAVGVDVRHPDAAARLRQARALGHEVACHSFSHPYALVRLDRDAIRREVHDGLAAVADAVGEAPVGFRAPGYNVSDDVFDALAEARVRYDSSVFPSLPYYAAKAGVLAWMRLRGRTSASVLGDVRVLRAPTRPYRIGRPYTRRGDGLIEIPIGVVPGVGLPFIGTTLVLAGKTGARALTTAMTVRPFVNLELHGIDLCDADEDDLVPLRRHQPDLRRPRQAKAAALRAAIEVLRGRGYRFVRLCDVPA